MKGEMKKKDLKVFFCALSTCLEQADNQLTRLHTKKKIQDAGLKDDHKVYLSLEVSVYASKDETHVAFYQEGKDKCFRLKHGGFSEFFQRKTIEVKRHRDLAKVMHLIRKHFVSDVSDPFMFRTNKKEIVVLKAERVLARFDRKQNAFLVLENEALSLFKAPRPRPEIDLGVSYWGRKSRLKCLNLLWKEARKWLSKHSFRFETFRKIF